MINWTEFNNWLIIVIGALCLLMGMLLLDEPWPIGLNFNDNQSKHFIIRGD